MWTGVLAPCLSIIAAAQAADSRVWRFDCGPADSPAMQGYTRLTEADQYAARRGYGW